jgi:predicted nucleotidyltransferase
MYLKPSNKKIEKLKGRQYEEILHKITDFFEQNSLKFSNIESVVLFGSYALKNYNNKSDIDLCIIFKENVSKAKESEVHERILDLSKNIEKNIDVLYIYPEIIKKYDHTLIESILAQGILIYGSEKYRKLFFKNIKLHPYQVISFSLKNLDHSEKMKFNRMIYGYETTVKRSGKAYDYKRKGLLEKMGGRRLGSGMVLIPESKLSLFERRLKELNIKFAHFRIWKQEI